MPELEAFQGLSSNSLPPPMGKGGNMSNGNLSDSASESDAELREESAKETKEVPSVLNVVSAVLERLVARNERLGSTVQQTTSTLNARKLTSFHGLRAPGISISKYMERIYKYTNCSPSCFVVGYIYIDRLLHKQPDLPITTLNVHRLLVTSVLVATKLLDDVHFNNAFFARVGGVSVVELNRLELELLSRLNFKVQVAMPEFEFYCTHLEKEIMRDERTKMDRSLPLMSPVPTFRSPTFRSPAASPLLTTPKKRISATLSGNFDRAAVHALISNQLADSPSR